MAVAPFASAVFSTSRFIASKICCFCLASNVRMVPIISTVSGMMLLRTPPLMMPTDTTAGFCVMSICRLTTVCMALTICAATTMGSTPCQGREPCVCLPVTTTFQACEPAMNGPLR